MVYIFRIWAIEKSFQSCMWKGVFFTFKAQSGYLWPRIFRKKKVPLIPWLWSENRSGKGTRPGLRTLEKLECSSVSLCWETRSCHKLFKLEKRAGSGFNLLWGLTSSWRLPATEKAIIQNVHQMHLLFLSHLLSDIRAAVRLRPVTVD